MHFFVFLDEGEQEKLVKVAKFFLPTALAYIFNKEVSLVYNLEFSANALTESAINKIRIVFIYKI